MEIENLAGSFTDDDLYKFTMCCAIVDNFPNAIVTCRFQDRDNKTYPSSFCEELKKQIDNLLEVKITDEEIEFMRDKCYYLPVWFFDFLKGINIEVNYKMSLDEENHLHFEYTGLWAHVVLLEVKLLRIINRLYYIMSNQTEDIIGIDYNDYYDKTFKKAAKIFSNDLSFAEFGTRRRYSFEAQETAVKACLEASRMMYKSFLFAGTSNVYLAMKYNLKPIGTMAHEWICGIAGLYGSPVEANYLAMEYWEKTYNGALGTYLYDSFGFETFEKNFTDKYARSFDGLRVDSGNNFDQYAKIYHCYDVHRVDPYSKCVMFSNALSTDSYIELGNKLRKVYTNPKFSAGIGTHLTNDFEQVKPCNNVIKLVKIAWDKNRTQLPTCKFSNDPGKYIAGDERTAEYWKYLINLNKK